MTVAAETASLRERISELEETNANLRRLEAAIQRNARLFEALLGANPGGIALTRQDGSIIRVVHGILGYVSHSLDGTPIADLVHPEDRDAIQDCYRELSLDPRRPVQCEVRVRKADGVYQWVEFTITDMLDNPAVMALVHNYRDITGRRRRRIFGAELDALAANTGAAVFSVDREGNVQTWHPACERLLGYTAAETEGFPVREYLPAAVVESPGAAFRTDVLTRSGHAIPVELAIAPLIPDRSAQVVVYIVRPL